MKAKHLEGDALVDQRSGASEELVLVREKCEDHAYTEAPVDDETDRQPDGENALKPEDQPVGDRLPDADSGQSDIGVDRVREPGLPQGMARRFLAEQAQGHDAPHRFNQRRMLLARSDD